MSKAEDILRSLAGNLGTGKPTVIPSIPVVPGTGDTNVDQFLSAIKQTVETWAGKRGDSLDSAVTWRELVNKQFATIDLTGGVPNGGTDGTPPVKPATQNDLTPPPSPTNLVASGALSTIILDWDVPAYGNHAYTEIWRSSTNVLGTAERIGMSPGAVYADNVGGGHAYYYWIRFVSTADIVGPYNKTDGTLGETSLDPGYLLEVLSGQISESELAAELSSRINLVDAPASVPGSTAYRVLQETNARMAAIASESNARTLAINNEISARQTADSALQTQINLISAASSGDFGELIAAIQEEQTARVEGDLAEASARQVLASQVEWDKNQADISRAGLNVLGLANKVFSTASIETEQTARATQDGAIAQQITTLSASIGSNSAAIQTEATTRANADSANANLISQVQARLDTGDYAAVKVDASTALTKATGAEAKYSVKLDVNGYVSGFGLISTANNATPFSQFIFKADQFAFGAPGLTSAYPFVIQASAATVNGVAVPAGVYIDAAYIKNGTITSAKIGNAAIDNAKIADAAINNAKIDSLDASKITTGTLDANRIGANSITAQKIDSRGLTIKDAAGTVLFGAGTALSTTYINGLGAFATLNTITSANVSTYIADAAITNAKIINLDASKISTGTLDANRIGANSITADKITANSLSAITANLGTVTTGLARNSTNTSYLNLSATGASRFLQCGGNVAINADGSGYFARSIVSAPNIIASGNVGVWSGRIPWETNGWVYYIDTGISVGGSWTTASTNQYLATATISGGQSWSGGGNGYTKADIVIGDGLVTYGGATPIDNRIYIRFQFDYANGPGAIGIGSIQWKLCQV